MLSCLGEAPVSTLDSGLPTDATIAQNILDEVNREVQSRRWWFNTIIDQTLTPNASGKIVLPTNWSTVDHPTLNYIKRGSYLYDLDKATDVFTSAVTELEVVTLLEFSEIPEPVRVYIIARASRILFERMVGEGQRASMLAANEQQAYLQVMQFDGDTTDANIFNNSYIYSQLRRY